MKENLTMLMDLYELTMANGIFYSDQRDITYLVFSVNTVMGYGL